MAFFNLKPHRDHPTALMNPVAVVLELSGRDALLRFEVPEPEKVVWPTLSAPIRADDLWQSTCFEMFLMLEGGRGYVEFNFSPSTRWAAYVFRSHREGREDLIVGEPPMISRLRGGVDVVCSLADVPCGDLRVGLSAVVEETDGAKSYWALAHAPGPPDFHNPACFIATLPPPPHA